MILLLTICCTQIFDISSSIFIIGQDGLAVSESSTTFCQALTSSEVTEKGEAVVISRCTDEPILDGVTTLPNWEGTYKGEIMDFQMWMLDGEKEYQGDLIDSDEDVWCDNVDIDTDANGNTTSTPFCTSNFEYFFVWQVVISD